MEDNLKLIKEIILDEKRIVTYISISKELCVHVNEAKLLLQDVVEAIKKEQPDMKLNINYIVSGLSDTNKGQVTICPDSDLQKLRKSFKIVYFSHMYSVNKGCNLLDKVAYTSINTFEDIPLCMGLIKNDYCFKRTSDEISNLNTNSQVAASSNIQNEQKLQKDTKPIKAMKRNGHEDTQNGMMAKKIEKLPEIKVKQEISSPDKKTNNITKTVDKKVVSKISKGIAGYFCKVNSMSTTTNSNDSARVTKENKLQIKTEKVEIIEQETLDVEENPLNEAKNKNKGDTKRSPVNGTKNNSKLDIKENPVKGIKNKIVDVKESPVNGSNSKKSNNLTKPSGKVDKKRKRVLHVSDSESDQEENDPFTEKMNVDNESDDEIPPTPTVNTVKITSGIVNPKKRRKIVDKTYTDEEGYILTKKEEVYESCSENEEETAKKENVENKTTNKFVNKIEVSPKGKNTKASKKKISPPQKGKQVTMTNFFKKV